VKTAARLRWHFLPKAAYRRSYGGQVLVLMVSRKPVADPDQAGKTRTLHRIFLSFVREGQGIGA